MKMAVLAVESNQATAVEVSRQSCKVRLFLCTIFPFPFFSLISLDSVCNGSACLDVSYWQRINLSPRFAFLSQVLLHR
jgi:hypothetical protein